MAVCRLFQTDIRFLMCQTVRQIFLELGMFSYGVTLPEHLLIVRDDFSQRIFFEYRLVWIVVRQRGVEQCCNI